MRMHQLAAFQVKAVALPIAEKGLNPEAFATTTPGVTISALVRDHVARCIFVAGPVGDQVNWLKGVLLGEGHVLDVMALTLCHTNRLQRLPVGRASAEQGV